MINNHSTQQRRRIPVERRFIFRPDLEEKGWTYAHHPFLTVFRGRFYAVFSNGIQKEDRPRQRVMLSVSEDFIHWSPPAPLFESVEGRPVSGVLTPGGFHEHEGRLACYAGLFEFEEEAYRTGDFSQKKHVYANLYALTTEDGVNWSKPVDLGLPVLPNHGPSRLASGRLLMCGNFTFPYSDDPSGLSGWEVRGIHPRVWNNFMDTPYGHTVNTRELDCGTALCEGSFFQTGDGVIHMLLRSLSGLLWLTESRDDGETWSPPRESGFTDCGSKFHFGRLGGGYYCVGTPDPGSPRLPLVLSLSRDGENFDRQYILADTPPGDLDPPLQRTAKVYGYPHTLVHGDSLYCITSICKTGIMVFRTELRNLDVIKD